MTDTFSLRDRFVHQGTLSDPQGIPDPAFTLQPTLNWMRALALLVEDSQITPDTMQERCAAVEIATLSDQAINTAFEQLLMSLHHVASLKAISTLPQRIDPARSAIVTWYYAIFHAASAMIAAQDGSYQESHAETANSWDRQIAIRPFVPNPFNYRVTTLVARDVENEIKAFRGGNTFALDHEPLNAEQATGACISYLNGSAKWRGEYIEEDLKRRELQKLGLENFRTKKAQKIRDERLRGKAFGFIHQAFRYRGKANYREALFISYGSHVEGMLGKYFGDLFSVSQGFLSMAGSFCARRIGEELWDRYHDDLSDKAHLLVKPSDVWCKL